MARHIHIREIGTLMSEKATANDSNPTNPNYIKFKNKIVVYHKNTAARHS